MDPVIMKSHCRYFHKNGDGARCGLPPHPSHADGSNHYCRFHGKKADVIFDALAEATTTASATAQSIYELCSRYWENEPAPSDPYAVLSAALNHCFLMDTLRKIAADMGATPYAQNLRQKSAIVTAILARNHALWRLTQQRPHLPHSINALKAAFRATATHRAAGLNGPYPSHPAVNEQDPFTFEDLASLDPARVFSYRDARGAIYAFDAAELSYYFLTSASPNDEPINPYTREPIPAADLSRLERLMKRIPNKEIQPPETLWRTARDAHAYTLHYYEREGFYTNIDHFCALTMNDIGNIFIFFHENTRDRYMRATANSPRLMDCEACFKHFSDAHAPHNPADATPLHFTLAKEMLNIISTDFPSRFYVICNLFLAIANVSTAFQRSLPQWVIAGAMGRVR